MSESNGQPALSGDLGREPLEKILRLLAVRNDTGVLEVKAEGRKTTLEITAGDLTAARASDDEGEAALGQVVGAREGAFAFHLGRTGSANLRGNLDEVLQAARAVADELGAIRAEIPNDRVRFALSHETKTLDTLTLSSDAQRVLLAVDGHRTVEDIVARCGLGRFKTLQYLRHLMMQGLTESTAGPTRSAAEAVEPVTPEQGGPRTSLFEYHYLPRGVEPAQLEIEKPAQKTAGLLGRLGFGREPSSLDIPPPPQLAAFANELATEFRLRAAADAEVSDRRGGLGIFSVPMASRLERIYLSDPIGHSLPLREDRIDTESLATSDHAPSDVVRYLAMLIGDLRDAAEIAWGQNEAQEIYDAVAHRVFGRSLITEPEDIVRHTRPQVRGRVTVRIGGTGSFDLAQRTYVVGRVSSCDIVLADATVSNRHARLTPHLEGFVIADLGSTNGTSVNGERLSSERVLRGGEVLRLGDATLLYERLT
jgi:hypothetical protein